MQHLAHEFSAFLAEANRVNPLKAEYFLPSVVNKVLKAGDATVAVRAIRDRWFGVTNPDDRPRVEAALRELTQSGQYPDGLWL